MTGTASATASSSLLAVFWRALHAMGVHDVSVCPACDGGGGSTGSSSHALSHPSSSSLPHSHSTTSVRRSQPPQQQQRRGKADTSTQLLDELADRYNTYGTATDEHDDDATHAFPLSASSASSSSSVHDSTRTTTSSCPSCGGTGKNARQPIFAYDALSALHPIRTAASFSPQAQPLLHLLAHDDPNAYFPHVLGSLPLDTLQTDPAHACTAVRRGRQQPPYSAAFQAALVQSNQKLIDAERARKQKLPASRTAAFVMSFFEQLNFAQQTIQTINPGCVGFDRLLHLTLTGNQIRTLCNLPPHLQALHANANQIAHVEWSSSSPPPPLVHLGLGCNRLRTIDSLLAVSTTVRSLDVSFNDLDDLAATLDTLRRFPKLQHLWLKGNPFCMRYCYRAAVLATLPALETLDDAPAKLDLALYAPQLESLPASNGAASASSSSLKPDGTASAASTARSRASSNAAPGGAGAAKGGGGEAGKKGAGGAGKKGKDEDSAEDAEAAAQQAREAQLARRRNALRAVELGFRPTPEALVQPCVLTIRLGNLQGVPEPPRGTGLALADDADAALLSPGKKDKAKKEKADAAKKKGGKKPEEEEAVNPNRVEKVEEITTPAGDIITIHTVITKQHVFYLQYRLLEEVYRTREEEWAETIPLEYERTHAFHPNSAWRDLLGVQGLDVLLFQRSQTTTEVTTTSPITSTPPSPSAADMAKKGGATGAPQAAASGKKSPRAADKDKKKQVEMKVETRTSAESKTVLLAIAHLDTARFIQPAPNRLLTMHALDEPMRFGPAPSEPFDPEHERLLQGRWVRRSEDGASLVNHLSSRPTTAVPGQQQQAQQQQSLASPKSRSNNDGAAADATTVTVALSPASAARVPTLSLSGSAPASASASTSALGRMAGPTDFVDAAAVVDAASFRIGVVLNPEVSVVDGGVA